MAKKRFALIALCIGMIGALEAQSNVTMELLATFPVGVGPDKLEYSVGPYEGDSPASFAFVSGRLLWIGERTDAKLFDVLNRRIEQVVPYPPADTARRIRVGIYHVFTSDYLYLRNVNILRYRVSRDPVTIGAPRVLGASELGSRPYPIRDYVFFHDADGWIHAIDPSGAELSATASKALLQSWLGTTWYPIASDREFCAKMINTGKYIIADGLFYPASGQQMLEYFTAKGTRIDADLSDNLRGTEYTTPPDGMSFNGDIYIGFRAGVYVVSQSGRTEAVIDDNAINPVIVDPKYNSGSARNNVNGLLYAVHPNGDFYTLYAIKDDIARIHRAVKTWGNDLIGMARVGLAAENEAEMRQRLQVFSSIELRLLRNALLALHGFAFRSWDLNAYFGGYGWYAPDPKVKNDSSILTEEQRRLFDIVAGIEKQRVVPH